MESNFSLLSLKQKLQKEGEIILTIKVIPKSKKTQLVGLLNDGKLKIKIAAVPEKGKANQELIKFLSKIFEVKSRQIEIIQGETSPLKTIKINLL